MSKKILVTGSAGRLGGMIVQQLLDKGYSCVGTDRMPFSGSPCEFVQCDLCDAGEVEKLFAASDITDVVHVAAVPGPAACVPVGCDPRHAATCGIGLEDMDPRQLFQNNVSSAYNVFHYASSNKVRRVVFSSSAFAVGWSHDPHCFKPKYLPLDETHPLMPAESYGLSKQCGENIADMLSKNSKTSFVSLRFTNVIHKEKEHLLPWTSPSVDHPVTPIMWNYTAASDVADAHVLALEASNITGHEAFLLSAPNSRYQRDTKELIAEHWGADEIELREGLDDNSSIISSKKAQEWLGWKPTKLW